LIFFNDVELVAVLVLIILAIMEIFSVPFSATTTAVDVVSDDDDGVGTTAFTFSIELLRISLD